MRTKYVGQMYEILMQKENDLRFEEIIPKRPRCLTDKNGGRCGVADFILYCVISNLIMRMLKLVYFCME